MFYLGIDVSKATLDCCLLTADSPDKRKNKVVNNSAAGMANLLRWLEKQGATLERTHALLEATGVYHESAATSLYDHGVTVSILNPARVKNFGKGLGLRTKTDSVDSWLLARFGQLQKPSAWQPPPAHVRELRDLLARHQALSDDLQREQNRLEKAQSSETTPNRIHQSLRDCIAFLKQQLKQLQKDIDKHINQHPDLKRNLALLQSIPAVGPKVGGNLLCVMLASCFRTAEQLAAYLGVVPVERQSGTSVLGRSRLSKAGPARIRALLYMAAIVGIRYNRHVKTVYERLLARGKSKMAALGAAMRKIVHLCFGLLKHQTPYMENPAYAS